MRLELSCDNTREYHAPLRITIEVEEWECTRFLENEYEERRRKAKNGERVERYPTMKEAMDRVYKDSYNHWQREHRRREGYYDFGSLKDNRDLQEREQREDYEATCQFVRKALKQEWADLVIAVCLDGEPLTTYAKNTKQSRENASQKLKRAKRKLADLLGNQKSFKNFL